MTETKKEEKNIRLSPGFLLAGKKMIFEQVDEANYVVYDLVDAKFQVDPVGPTSKFYDADKDIVYTLLPRIPWPMARPHLSFSLIETGELWQQVKTYIFDHVDVVDSDLYHVLTAWVFATYLPEIWMVVPYLFFFGPIASGKTRALEAIQQLSYRGIIGSNVSAASLFRGLEAWHPTVFLDETEIYSKTEHLEIIGLLNSGYRRGQYAWRCKNTDQGAELELFDVFGFKALSGTEGLAKALESRSIMVRMMKNTRPVRFLIDQEKGLELRSKLLMWRLLMLKKLFGEGSEGCEPFLEPPSDLDFANGRLMELFQPLLAVANDGRENIVKYAKKVQEIRSSEEATGLEALILEALVKSENKVDAKIILTKDVTGTLNIGLDDKDKFKQWTVGRIMRKLGFLPRHTRQGNGWFWDADRIKLLKAWYLPEDQTPPEDPSHPSHGSQDGLQPFINQHEREGCEPCEPSLEVLSTPTNLLERTCGQCVLWHKPGCSYPGSEYTCVAPANIYAADCRNFIKSPLEDPKTSLSSAPSTPEHGTIPPIELTDVTKKRIEPFCNLCAEHHTAQRSQIKDVGRVDEFGVHFCCLCGTFSETSWRAILVDGRQLPLCETCREDVQSPKIMVDNRCERESPLSGSPQNGT